MNRFGSLLLVLFSAVFLASSALAQETKLSYLLYRTYETPGFFLLDFRASDGFAIPAQTVFVKNFPKSEKKKYEPVLKKIAEKKARIIGAKDTDPYEKSNAYRLVSLGNEVEKLWDDELIIDSEDVPEEELQDFFDRQNTKVYLKNVRINFSDNTSEVYPMKNNFLGEESVVFVGKFFAEKKALVTLEGFSVFGEISSTFEIDFAQYETPLDFDIVQTWQRYQEQSQEKKSSEIPAYKNWINNLFPVLILLLGIWLLFLWWRIKKNNEVSFENEDWYRQKAIRKKGGKKTKAGKSVDLKKPKFKELKKDEEVNL